jgi:hypothetical protein
MKARKAYPGDGSDDEWTFVAPYLTLMDETAQSWQCAQLQVPQEIL